MALAIIDYATLTAAINDWSERSYTSAQTDQFIALAEAEFRLYLGPSFARETSAVLTFVAGSVAQPTGFIRAIGLTHLTYGALTERTIGSVRERRVFDTSGIPDIFAVTGSTIEVAPSYDGALTMDLEASLIGLSGSNTTNWLITNAPQAYLSMCLSMAKARDEDFGTAGTYKQAAMTTLNDLGIQSVVGQLGRSSPRIAGHTP